MSERGFTLVELLVVLAIMAMTLTIAVPRFSQVLPGSQLREATQALAASLREARGRAIRTGRAVALTLDLDAGLYRIEGDAESDPTALPDALALAFDGGPLSHIGDGERRIRFFPDGGATGGSIALSSGARSRSIDVDWLTGRVRVGE